jgi:hypothetical protein
VAREVTLRVPGLYPHQQRLDEAPQPFKLARWGRRAGKTVWIFRAAVMGHGPLGADGEPIHKGLRHGKDVVWVGRSKDQARTIWNNEVRPRFEATGVANINDTLFTATMPGFGKLIVKSQDRDSISNVRGMGDTIGGVVGDEVAHWDDAESAWLDVLLPVLTDNLGWFAAVSTTEPGSWFNRQCADIMAGNKPVNTWFHTHATAKDNPRISPVAFERLLAEYPDGDPARREGGVCGADGGWRWARDADPRESMCWTPRSPRTIRKRNVTFFGSVDWGFAHPFSFGLYMVEGDGKVIARGRGAPASGGTPSSRPTTVRGLLARYNLTFKEPGLHGRGRGRVRGQGPCARDEGHDDQRAVGEMRGWYVRRGRRTRRVAGLSNHPRVPARAVVPDRDDAERDAGRSGSCRNACWTSGTPKTRGRTTHEAMGPGATTRTTSRKSPSCRAPASRLSRRRPETGRRPAA